MIGVAGIGGNMVGIPVIVVVECITGGMEENGIGGRGDTEREFGSGIRVRSVVEGLVPIEVSELQDERLEREPRDIEVGVGDDVEGDEILSLTFITFVF